jgi:protein ATS1
MSYKLYALGSNGNGQLGLGHLKDVSIPTRCLDFPSAQAGKPVMIAAGGNHTLVRTALRKTFSLGKHTDQEDSKCSAEGSGEMQTSHQAREFHNNSFLCSATWEASIIIDSEKRIYASGQGLKGELGCGVGVTQTKMSCVPFDPQYTTEDGRVPVIGLSSGMEHTVVVLENGETFGWGNGRHGQLGEPCETVWKPRKIEIPFKVERAECGRQFTYFVGSQGQHVVLGSDKWSVRSHAPSDVRGWKDIAVTWGAITVLFQNGKVRSWGRNDHGQIGSQKMPALIKVAAGSEHMLGYTVDRQIVAWGWGEHGNCGPDVDANGDVKDRFRVIELSSEDPPLQFLDFWAGCATSWILAWSDERALT